MYHHVWSGNADLNGPNPYSTGTWCSEGRAHRLTAAVIVLWSDTAAHGAPVALKHDNHRRDLQLFRISWMDCRSFNTLSDELKCREMYWCICWLPVTTRMWYTWYCCRATVKKTVCVISFGHLFKQCSLNTLWLLWCLMCKSGTGLTGWLDNPCGTTRKMSDDKYECHLKTTLSWVHIHSLNTCTHLHTQTHTRPKLKCFALEPIH